MLRTYARARLVGMEDGPDDIARYVQSNPRGLKADRIQTPSN
jgi:hypothetical protein